MHLHVQKLKIFASPPPFFCGRGCESKANGQVFYGACILNMESKTQGRSQRFIIA